MRDWKDGACDDLCAFKSNILCVDLVQPIKGLFCDGLSCFRRVSQQNRLELSSGEKTRRI